MMARSHISSANHMDLRKRALAAAKGSSGRMIQWVEMPSRDGASERGGVENNESGEAQGLSASEVGAPVKVRGETVVMNTPLGLLRDGEVFFTHMGVDLEKALVQWRATNGEGGGASERRSGSLGGRNPNWNSGGQEAGGPRTRRLPQRREVGIKIRTEFDGASAGAGAEADAAPSKPATSPNSSQETPAGSAVEAARLLPRSSA